MNHLHIWLVFALFIFACARPTDQGFDQADSLSFEKVDSLDLAILGDPTLVGVSPTINRLAFYDFPSREFVFTDPSGQVISRFSKKEDTPDAYGFLMEFPCFLSDSQIALAGMKGIFVYDLQGKMITKMAHPELVGSAGFMTFPGKGMKHLSLDDRSYLLTKSVRTRNTYPGEQVFYDSFRALELVDLEEERFLEIVPFEEGSQFLDGNGYYESDYAPAYSVMGRKLYVALGGENRLRVYTLSATGARLDTTIHLQIPGFGKLPVTSREAFSKGSVMIKGSTPAIRNIHVVDGNLAIHYYGGISEETMEELEAIWLSGDEEKAEELYSEAEKDVRQGVLVLDQATLMHRGILEFPEGINKRGFASGGGYVWMERLPDEENEEDFLRIYKVKMVSK